MRRMRHFRLQITSAAAAKWLCRISLLVLLTMFQSPAVAELVIHVIDVGQGDALLVQCDGSAMLIDAGPLPAGTAVNRYLRETLGLEKLDVVIATHEHDDHLFGMPDALAGMKVDQVYTPKAVPMSYWFGTILPVLSQKQLNVKRPEPGEMFELGNHSDPEAPGLNAAVQFLNTLTESENANNLCLVVRIDYGSSSALLTADIEGDAEMHMVQENERLKADLLKVAHHGGNTSSCEAFLNAVNPKYAVISVGKDNKHSHPHQEILNRLKKRNVQVYRTDEFGTILCISDGEDWTFKVSKAR